MKQQGEAVASKLQPGENVEREPSDDFAARGMSHSYRRPERRQTLLILIFGPKCRPITKISVRPRCRVKCNGPSSPASGLFGLPSHCPTLSAPACSYSDSFSVNSSSSSQISISYVASSSSRSLAKAYVPHLPPHATHQHTYVELPSQELWHGQTLSAPLAWAQYLAYGRPRVSPTSESGRRGLISVGIAFANS